jgi:hypothetical protein
MDERMFFFYSSPQTSQWAGDGSRWQTHDGVTCAHYFTLKGQEATD